MPHLKQNTDHHLLEEFIKELEATTQQVQLLLRDIRESELEFASTKTELKIFVENVKELSSLIREGGDGGSLLTRVALVEKSVEEIESWIKIANQKKETQIASTTQTTAASQHAIQVAEKAGRWQLITAIATGILALLTSTISLIINLLGKH